MRESRQRRPPPGRPAGFQQGAGFGLESGTHLSLTWMSSMRRYAHCMILLLMPFAASATAALDDNHGACVYSTGDAASQRAPTATAAPSTAKPAPVRPAASSGGTSTGGGGSDDDVLQRIRAPKWHSYLPGMFR